MTRGILIMEKYGYKIYNEVDELPEWAKESVKKAVAVGVLKGTGEGLGLTQTEVKMIVWLDRCGLFDQPNPQHDDVVIPEK